MRIELIRVKLLRIIPGIKCSVNTVHAYHYCSNNLMHPELTGDPGTKEKLFEHKIQGKKKKINI